MSEMKLSKQAIAAVMMALQKSLMEQSDIVPVLEGFKVKLSDEGLVVLNPQRQLCVFRTARMIVCGH